ncbi:hypothetical protein [Flavobacterium sp. CS20]
MIKYSFVGNSETVKNKMQQFLNETLVDELMITSAIYDHLHDYILMK